MAVPARDSHRKLAKANHLRVKGDLDAAYSLCEEVLAEFPHELDAYLLMAQIASDRGDEQEALHWSRMAADLAPDLGKVESLRLSLEERLEEGQEPPPLKGSRRKNQALVFAFACLSLMAAAVWAAFAFSGNPELRPGRPTVQLNPLVIDMRPSAAPVSSEPLPMASHLSMSPSAADVRLHSAILDRVGTARQIFVSSADQQTGLLLSVMALERDDPLKCAAFFALALDELNPGKPMLIQVLQRRQVVLVARTRPRPAEFAARQMRYNDPSELADSSVQGLFAEVQQFDVVPGEPPANSVPGDASEPQAANQ